MSDLYELPNGWEWKTLQSFGKFLRGVTYKKEQLLETKTEDSLILLRANNIQNELNLDEVQFIPKDVGKGKVIEDGDILFAMSSGSKHLVGKNILINGLNNHTFGAFCSVYRNVKKDILNNYFLSYILKSNLYREKLSDLSMGANINNLKSSDLEIIKIPLPPLSEQQRIVSKLDLLFEKIDKSIALHQKNMDEADVFMGSVLNDVFGELEEKYGLKKVSDGLEKILTGTTPPTKDRKYYDNPTINWYSPSDFGKSKLLTKSKNMINEISLMDKKAKIYEKNTLLLVAIGATVGKIGVIKEEASSNQQITAMKFKNNIDVDFSYYWFYYIKQTIINTASAATLPIINQSAIKDLKFIIPPLNIQQKVVKYLDEILEKIEKVKSVQKVKMDSLKALKASILDRAFRGKL